MGREERAEEEEELDRAGDMAQWEETLAASAGESDLNFQNSHRTLAWPCLHP